MSHPHTHIEVSNILGINSDSLKRRIQRFMKTHSDSFSKRKPDASRIAVYEAPLDVWKSLLRSSEYSSVVKSTASTSVSLPVGKIKSDPIQSLLDDLDCQSKLSRVEQIEFYVDRINDTGSGLRIPRRIRLKAISDVARALERDNGTIDVRIPRISGLIFRDCVHMAARRTKTVVPVSLAPYTIKNHAKALVDIHYTDLPINVMKQVECVECDFALRYE